MNIPSIIALILIFLYFIYARKGLAYKRHFITWGCLLLGLEAGLRHISVGPDTPHYYEMFKYACNSSWTDVFSGFTVGASEFRDPAFVVLEKIFSQFIPSWQLFLVAVAFFYFYGLWKILTRYTESIEGALLAFILYLSLFNIIALSGLRQCITTGIAFYLIPLINDRKWKIVIPIILAGSTIHISLLFMLGFIPLMIMPNRIKKSFYLIAIILMPVIAISSRSIVSYMASFLANDYYASYANGDNDESPIVYVLLCAFISIYEYLNCRKLIESKRLSFLVPSNILMTLSVPLIFLDGTMIRIGQYFTLYMMVSLPYVFDHVSYRRIAYVVCTTFLIYRVLTSSNIYNFFWENVPGFMYY